jgi:hypothetical protein|eukprot:COSAG01_NODE_18582_length_1066_cov_1.196484_1_plen_79_part_00
MAWQLQMRAEWQRKRQEIQRAELRDVRASPQINKRSKQLKSKVVTDLDMDSHEATYIGHVKRKAWERSASAAAAAVTR